MLTVVFDLGEVLVSSTTVLPRLAAELDVGLARFTEAYRRGRLAYDAGGPAADYWTGVVTTLGRAPDPAFLARLRDLDAEKWSVLPSESRALLDALAGVRLGVLSNAPAPLAAAVRTAAWSGLIDVLVFSAELGLVKPDPAIYLAADAAYATTPDEVVFFDDRPDNVAAAREHGWDAHVYAGPAAVLDLVGTPGGR